MRIMIHLQHSTMMNPKQLLVLIVVLHSSTAYRMYKLNDLCSTNLLKISFDFITDNKPEVQLQSDDRSGAFVPLSWNGSMLKKHEVCNFKVEANKYGRNRGIFATLQRMNLRTKPNGECIDFIRFKHENGESSARICGRHNASDDYTTDMSKFFSDDVGRIQVHIELDGSRQLSQDDGNLEVQLYLTAFAKDCSSPSDKEILCSAGRCISRQFENDGIVNCPPQQCSDEQKCVHQIPIRVTPEISGKNFAISAITSLVGTMAAVLCIYMCCRYKHCRDPSPGGSNGGTAANQRSLTGQRVEESDFQNIELPTSSDQSSHPIRPSAPGIDVKDLPPTYESLFIKNETPGGH